MYIGWIPHYIPILFGLLAFLVNPIFVYLVFTGKSMILGNYRFLLLYFAIFNVIYSILEIAVPIGVSGYRYCFYLFLTDGFFENSSVFNHYILTIRCSMLSCSYAILVSHFVYRYLVIQSSKYTNTRFPNFMAGSFGLCFVYFLFFAWICECWMYAPDYLKEYFREDFIREYGSDPKNFNMFTGIYNEANSEDIIRTWCGVIMLVILSGGSISIYFFFGHKIMKKLNEAGALATMSQDTATLQRKLLKALTVQTIIPICISFAPSVVVWLSPVFNISMGRIYNHTGTIALSAFPFFDPVAIIFFLPVLRHRLYKAKPSEIPTRSVSVTMTTLNIP